MTERHYVVVRNGHYNLLCVCNQSFSRPSDWLAHRNKFRRSVEETVAQEIADELRLPVPHSWRRDEDGDIDLFQLEYDNHNGPRCSRCDESFCMHCSDKEWGEPCEQQNRELF